MQRLKIVLTAFCILFLSAIPAIASGAEHNESVGNLIWRLINFAAFIGVVSYFFGKKIVGFFKGRTEGIAAEIASLEERKADARQKLDDVEKRIANLEEERRAIIAEYTAQGEAMKAAIIARAEESAAKITAQAKTTAQSEIKTAVDAMRAEMAEKIASATEQLIAKKLSAAEHAKLIDKYVTLTTKAVLN